ncbi:hypothetical protein QVZ41_13980 [Wenyingzhuangia sp. chi5]|uniref:Beta-lactamase-inhibitor-like PepSY-like domain-containing protein n=1 Tax=Wenyingzhuangia gilva TaxID=3057677 RepID=A0ABT8VVH5_9FLAO|nr:hypothetical protein [Wenyingzhuangia sp. chi5]MDO3695956.1 hypothetical protein [Wenyingzhuangia sp. chi5]
MKIRHYLTLTTVLVFLNSCETKQNGHLPLNSEERAISQYLTLSKGVNQNNHTIKFISTEIINITVNDMKILSNEENFDIYEKANDNNENIIINNSSNKYNNRESLEIIAKKIKCKYISSVFPETVVTQNFILDKTGQKLIYSDDFKNETRLK